MVSLHTPLDVDVVFSIVGYPSDVREVALGENGVIEGLRAGSIYVDMTTSEPSLAVELAAAAAAKVLSFSPPPLPSSLCRLS